MKLLDFLTEAGGAKAGYFEPIERPGMRQWVPHFGSVDKDAKFPFAYMRNSRLEKSQVNNFQAYDILPNRKRRDLGQDALLFQGLEDALKQRSETNAISDGDFNKLLDNCTTALLSKDHVKNLKNQNPKRIFITTPPSSSNVTEVFARRIQSALGVANDQMYLGHFTKRDVIEVIDDVMASEKINPRDREEIPRRLEQWYNNREDTTFKIKDLLSGHRHEMAKAEIPFLNVERDFKLPGNLVPYLLIVDDNVQSGSTAREVARLFIQNTGVSPANVFGLAMFKYP